METRDNEAAGEADDPHDSEAGSADQNFETLGIEEISSTDPVEREGCEAARRRPRSDVRPANQRRSRCEDDLSWIRVHAAIAAMFTEQQSLRAADGNPLPRCLAACALIATLTAAHSCPSRTRR